MTPKQCKAARELLGWKQQDLIERSKVSKRTISLFELGTKIPMPRTLESIMTTFEKHGIRFEDNENELIVKLIKNPNQN